jgi:hypothetical protein
MAWPILEDPMAQLMAKIEEGNREIHRCMDSMQSAMERMEIAVKGLLTDPSDCQRWRPGTGAKEDKVTQKTIEDSYSASTSVADATNSMLSEIIADGSTTRERTLDSKSRWNPMPEQIRIWEVIFNSKLLVPVQQQPPPGLGQFWSGGSADHYQFGRNNTTVASNNGSREVAHKDTTKLGLLQYDFEAIMAMEAAPVMAPLAVSPRSVAITVTSGSATTVGLTGNANPANHTYWSYVLDSLGQSTLMKQSQGLGIDMPHRSFPAFGDSKPIVWRDRCETDFELYTISSEMWIRFAVMHLEGSALYWLQLMKSRTKEMSWSKLWLALNTRVSRDQHNSLTMLQAKVMLNTGQMEDRMWDPGVSAQVSPRPGLMPLPPSPLSGGKATGLNEEHQTLGTVSTKDEDGRMAAPKSYRKVMGLCLFILQLEATVCPDAVEQLLAVQSISVLTVTTVLEVLVYNFNLKYHAQLLETVFQLLCQQQQHLKLPKCLLDFLGHKVSASGISTDRPCQTVHESDESMSSILFAVDQWLKGLHFWIVYKTWVDNRAADILSRRPDLHQDDSSVCLNVVSSSSVIPSWLVEVTKGYESDASAQKIMAIFSIGGQLEPFTLVHGVIRHKNKIWLVSSHELQQRTMKTLHDSTMCGQSGFLVTYRCIKAVLSWTGMKPSVRDFVRSCVNCQQAKTRHPFGFNLFTYTIGLHEFSNLSFPDGPSEGSFDPTIRNWEDRVKYSERFPLPVQDHTWLVVSMYFISGLSHLRWENCMLVVVDKLSNNHLSGRASLHPWLRYMGRGGGHQATFFLCTSLGTSWNSREGKCQCPGDQQPGRGRREEYQCGKGEGCEARSRPRRAQKE